MSQPEAEHDLANELKQLNQTMISVRRLLRVCAAALIGIVCISGEGRDSGVGAVIAAVAFSVMWIASLFGPLFMSFWDGIGVPQNDAEK